MARNLEQVFEETARRQPDRPAILGPGTDDRLSYGELRDAVAAAADRFRRAGVRAGHCVGLHVPSGRDYVILNYAVWRCGGCVIPVPVELTESEKQEIVRGIALDFVVSHPDALALAAPFRAGGHSDALPSGAVAVPVRSPRTHPAGFGEIDAAFIRFTSGTTGTSKGVVLSHQTILERIDAANAALNIGPDDRVVWLLSMSYHFAVSIVAYLSFGAAIVLPQNGLAPAILESVRRHRGTLIYGSPWHYALMAECHGAEPLPSLRLCISTAMMLDPAIAQAFHQRFGVPVSQALGVIEAGLPCINVDLAAERPESVGRVLPAYRVRLNDVGLGEALQEIWLSGPGFLDAYYDPWRPRAEIMPDGWFRTGDVGELDADGCLSIRGRCKDVINVAGMKVFPADIEAVLTSHPGVREACVYARPHPRLGEVPQARVVAVGATPVPTEQELLDHCTARLAPFKVPVGVEFVEVLERTASGKVLRREAGGPAADRSVSPPSTARPVS